MLALDINENVAVEERLSTPRHAIMPQVVALSGHFMILTFLVYLLTGRRWPMCQSVPQRCYCHNTEAYICFISACVNTTWEVTTLGISNRFVFQSLVWMVLGVVPALSGAWIIVSKSRRKMDVVVGVLSWGYVLCGYFTDTHASLYNEIHWILATVCFFLAFIVQFCLPWRASAIILIVQVASYFAISEVAVSGGADRRSVYDYATLFSSDFRGSSVFRISEWSIAFGCVSTPIMYYAMEIARRLRLNKQLKTGSGLLDRQGCVRDVHVRRVVHDNDAAAALEQLPSHGSS